MLARAVFSAAALATLALSATRLWSLSGETLLHYGPNDDAYYFLQWARNVAAGLGPSFDGVETTDGVRPVWAWSLVPFYWLTTDDELALRLCCMWGVLLHVVTFGWLARLLSGALGAMPATLAAVAFLLGDELMLVGSQAMDWPMNAVLQVALLACVLAMVRAERVGAGLGLASGVVVALNLLERPETLPLVLLLAAIGVARRRAWRPVWWTALGAVLVVVPYAAWSVAVFGRFGSVAGEIKTSLSLATLDGEGFVHDLVWTLARTPEELLLDVDRLGAPQLIEASLGGRLALVAGLGLAVLWLARGGRAHALARHVRAVVVWPTVLFAVFHAALVAALLHSHLTYGRWYLAPQDLAWCTLLAIGLSGVARRMPRGAAVATGVGWLALVAATTATAVRADRARLEKFEARDRSGFYAVVGWLTQNTDVDERIAAFNTGALAYYTPRTVTNLDGLMNTHRFKALCVLEPAKARRQLNLLRYLVHHEIRYLADRWPRSLGERVPEVALVGSLAEYFTLAASWPAMMKPWGEVNYQIYELDVERARELLVERGLEWTDEPAPE